MNTLTSREAIDENEWWWCENAIPVAPGSLFPVGLPTLTASVSSESGAPTYTTNFNAGGTDYAFSVWANSGNGWVTNIATFASTKIFNGTLTSGKTSATQWNNLGLLIIDPTGYFDWNVTTPNALTTQNNSVSGGTLNPTSVVVPGGTSLALQFNVSGTGATFTTAFSVTSVVVSSAGTGYAIGDQLLLSDNNPSTPAVITVTNVGGGGAIAGIALANAGVYPGPTSTTAVATGPAGSTFTTSSSGTGAVFTVRIGSPVLTVVNRGSGYKSTNTVAVLSGATVIATFALTVSGVLSGTTIAAYAGRVWIGNNRTVSFTDVGSYFSFGGSGGAFIINDAYLHNAITCLFAANNYLFIFGDDSIDALSNVTVVAGVISFSRINLTASIGTSNPNSVYSYLRGVAFYHASGFYLLSGATPEKISEKIAGVVAQITPTSVYGAPVVVSGELCAAFLFSFSDVFTTPVGVPVTRAVIALFFRSRWWVASMSGNPAALFSVPLLGVQTLFAWVGNTFYKLFSGAPSSWLLKSRIWDAGAPLKEKQALNVAGAFTFQGGGSSGINFHVDTEAGLGPAVPATFPLLTWINNAGQVLTWVNNASQVLTWEQSPVGYSLNIQEAQAGGTQYLGLTVTGQANVSRINMLALRGKQDRAMLA